MKSDGETRGRNDEFLCLDKREVKKASRIPESPLKNSKCLRLVFRGFLNVKM